MRKYFEIGFGVVVTIAFIVGCYRLWWWYSGSSTATTPSTTATTTAEDKAKADKKTFDEAVAKKAAELAADKEKKAMASSPKPEVSKPGLAEKSTPPAILKASHEDIKVFIGGTAATKEFADTLAKTHAEAGYMEYKSSPTESASSATEDGGAAQDQVDYWNDQVRGFKSSIINHDHSVSQNPTNDPSIRNAWRNTRQRLVDQLVNAQKELAKAKAKAR